jgi:hypothetical protein
MHTLRTMAVLMALAAPAWCAGAPAAAPPPATSKPAVKQGKSDAEIEKDIQARFAKSKIGVEKYQVHVQGGVATIEGKTNVIQHKGVATRLARSAGATKVINHIQISDAARAQAAQNLAKGRAQVKGADSSNEASRAAQK